MKILVIDDDQDVANLLVQHLEQSGHTIRCANNGRDGLDLAVTESVDLIIQRIRSC
jgi:DNA-binding response OmpR family regulator